jgi:hypothetical protein
MKPDVVPFGYSRHAVRLQAAKCASVCNHWFGFAERGHQTALRKAIVDRFVGLDAERLLNDFGGSLAVAAVDCPLLPFRLGCFRHREDNR